ncbi:hypothetical protein FRC12_022943 [Ceratobasidium sp. 428]|nr:hypothetical protein FRC12_022943 [Ceratobasidium sp. 428]
MVGFISNYYIDTLPIGYFVDELRSRLLELDLIAVLRDLGLEWSQRPRQPGKSLVSSITPEDIARSLEVLKCLEALAGYDDSREQIMEDRGIVLLLGWLMDPQFRCPQLVHSAISTLQAVVADVEMLPRLVTNRGIVEGVAYATKSPVFCLSQDAMAICQMLLDNADTQQEMNRHLTQMNISFINPQDPPMTLAPTGGPSIERSYEYIGLPGRSTNRSKGFTTSDLSNRSLTFHSPGSTFATVASNQQPPDTATHE